MPSELITAEERKNLREIYDITYHEELYERTLAEAVRLLRQIPERYDVLDFPVDLMMDVCRFLETVEGEK